MTSSGDPAPRWRDLAGNPRWLAAGALTVLASVALLWDLAPPLRGYKPWPPEWRWLYIPTQHPWFALPLVPAAALLLAVGWWTDRLRAAPARAALIVLLGLMAIGVQLLAVRARDPNAAVPMAQRTLVYFLEDFFQAAQQIDSPLEAYTKYEWLATEHNRLRVATHPPGMIAVYRGLIDVGDSIHERRHLGPTWADDLAEAAALKDGEKFALLLVTLFKLGGAVLAAAGLALMLVAVGAGAVVGRAVALMALVPGLVLFSGTLDQLTTGLSALAIGLLMVSVSRPSLWWCGILAGVVWFCESMLVYQFTVSLFLGVVASGLIVHTRRREGGDWQRGVAAILAAGLTMLMLLILVQVITGFSYFQRFFHGLSAHREGAIHLHRSRLGWLLWNPWDVYFFLGLGWTALWARKSTWAPILRRPLLLAFLLAWLLIVLGDGIRGETARLMMFTYPALVAVVTGAEAEGELNIVPFSFLGGMLLIQTTVFAAVLNVL